MRTIGFLLLLGAFAAADTVVLRDRSVLEGAVTRAEKKITVGGQEHRYRLGVPSAIEDGKRYPVVLFLHGAGERGRDNRAQLRHLPERLLAGGFDHESWRRAIVAASRQRPRGGAGYRDVPEGESSSLRHRPRTATTFTGSSGSTIFSRTIALSSSA